MANCLKRKPSPDLSCDKPIFTCTKGEVGLDLIGIRGGFVFKHALSIYKGYLRKQ